MRTLQQIKETLVSHKSKLFSDYPIKSMAIFGSYARDEQSNFSDLDILIEFSDQIGVRFIDLANEIEDIIGIKVDVVSKKGIKDKYLASIGTDLIYV